MTAMTSLARPTYRGISLYAPDRSPCRIDLSDNTNLWGMPPASRDALVATSAARYPSLYAAALKEALSAYTGLPAGMITTGCGSDDVLDSAMRALAEPGQRIAFTTPTFPMIPIFAQMNGLDAVVVPFEHLARTGARLLYVCSPNNPTGLRTPRALLDQLVAEMSDDQVLIIDEAYAEFAGENAADLARSSDRVLITRTLSKAFGLAGLRIGYALGNPLLVAEVEKSRGPYKVSAPAEAAAIGALTGGRGWVEEHIALAIENRYRLSAELRRRDLAPLDSAANFVFVPVADATRIAARMRELGVAVRAFGDVGGLRISVGPWALLEEALAAFDEARAT